MMNPMSHRRGKLVIQPAYRDLLRSVEFSLDWVWESPSVVVWRTLDDRENCTAKISDADGREITFHLKRYKNARDAANEARGLEYLQDAGIPTAPLAAWGRAIAGGAFAMTQDLAGHEPADKLIESGTPFAKLLMATAELAAKLHATGLHHRDLYLCHFLIDKSNDSIKLIDTARVRPLPAWPLKRRWIVKDLAQFWYSTLSLPITDEQRTRWLDHYVKRAKGESTHSLRKAIEAKVRRIAAHDVNLNRRQPSRHVSIPKSHR